MITTNYGNNNGYGGDGYGDSNKDGWGTTDGTISRIAMTKMEVIASRRSRITRTKMKITTTAAPYVGSRGGFNAARLG